MIDLRRSRLGPTGSRGFTFLGLLLATAITGTGLVAASHVWATQARLQQKQQLQWVGDQYVRAIASYYHALPTGRQLPASLDELLEDRRFAVVRRHLRSVYLNPLTHRHDWELVLAADGRIRGVRTPAGLREDSAPTEFVFVPSAP